MNILDYVPDWCQFSWCSTNNPPLLQRIFGQGSHADLEWFAPQGHTFLLLGICHSHKQEEQCIHGVFVDWAEWHINVTAVKEGAANDEAKGVRFTMVFSALVNGGVNACLENTNEQPFWIIRNILNLC
jgi:hypothetical protein